MRGFLAGFPVDEEQMMAGKVEGAESLFLGKIVLVEQLQKNDRVLRIEGIEDSVRLGFRLAAA